MVCCARFSWYWNQTLFRPFREKETCFSNASKVRLSLLSLLKCSGRSRLSRLWHSASDSMPWAKMEKTQLTFGSAQLEWFCVLAKVPIFISCFENQNGPFFVCNSYVFHSVPASESALRLTDRILCLPEMAVSLDLWRIWRIHQPGAAIFTDSKVHRSRKKTRSEGCEQTF